MNTNIMGRRLTAPTLKAYFALLIKKQAPKKEPAHSVHFISPYPLEQIWQYQPFHFSLIFLKR